MNVTRRTSKTYSVWAEFNHSGNWNCVITYTTKREADSHAYDLREQQHYSVQVVRGYRDPIERAIKDDLDIYMLHRD